MNKKKVKMIENKNELPLVVYVPQALLFLSV